MAQYAQVYSISAPSEALAGEEVEVRVTIKNLYTATIGVMVGGAIEYGVTPWPGINFPDPSDNCPAGGSRLFVGYFTMPNHDVTIHAYSYWYGGDGYWHFDDEKERDVDLDTLASEFRNFAISSLTKR